MDFINDQRIQKISRILTIAMVGFWLGRTLELSTRTTWEQVGLWIFAVALPILLLAEIGHIWRESKS